MMPKNNSYDGNGNGDSDDDDHDHGNNESQNERDRITTKQHDKQQVKREQQQAEQEPGLKNESKKKFKSRSIRQHQQALALRKTGLPEQVKKPERWEEGKCIKDQRTSRLPFSSAILPQLRSISHQLVNIWCLFFWRASDCRLVSGGRHQPLPTE